MLIWDAGLREALARAVGDRYSRRILLATMTRAKSIDELSLTEGVPKASAYRRANELRKEGLLSVETIAVSDDGKKRELYRCIFRSFKIEVGPGGELVTEAEVNEGISPRKVVFQRNTPLISA